MRTEEYRCQAMVNKRRSGVMHVATCNKLIPDGYSYCPRCKTPKGEVA